MLRITSNAIPGYPRILKRLAAAGLSRILEHMWVGPFGIISASLPDISKEENAKRTAQLKKVLQQRGQGFIDLKGGYLYQSEGKPKAPVKEDSVFLPNASESEVGELASLFDQESYISGEKGYWQIKDIKSGELWGHGLVEDMFETLQGKEVGEDYPFLSQIRDNEGHQFRLDPDLVQRRKRQQEEEVRQQRTREQGRIAFRLVEDTASPCFYSAAGNFRPRPPVCLAESNVMLSGSCPDGSLLECWLPLKEI